MAQVRFDNVRKAFGQAVAVQGLDLEIEHGAFVSLLGPSGCGKTTTLRMLAGLEFPTSGKITIGDRVVNDVPPGKRDIAMVFQSYALYPHMTVGENIAYPLKKHGVKRVEREAKVLSVASTLQLEHLLDRKPRQLSGGQQQRVALGRALVRNPQVFLLDEPLSNLDAKLRAHMRAELIELHRTVGQTFVYVTHDQLEAMTMSDKIAVMREGVLQQYDAPKIIYQKPANMFVAGFIGTPSMNFLSGEITRGASGLQFRHAAATLPIMQAGQAQTQTEGKAVLGVRPEDLQLGDGPLQATVRLIEPTGYETIVILDVEGASLVTRVPSDMPLKVGERVPMALRTDRLHLFDATSEERLDVSLGQAAAQVSA
jgi:multiple sugar transport system ATP-binding protein